MSGSSMESAQTLLKMLVYKRKAIGTRFEIPLRRTASRFCLLTPFDPQKFDAGEALAQDDTLFFTVANERYSHRKELSVSS